MEKYISHKAWSQIEKPVPVSVLVLLEMVSFCSSLIVINKKKRKKKVKKTNNIYCSITSFAQKLEYMQYCSLNYLNKLQIQTE